MRATSLLLALAASIAVNADSGTANIYEDALAHPQYDITFNEPPLTHLEAEALLKSDPSAHYETMKYSSRSFICSIPSPPSPTKNHTERSLTRSAEAAESSRAANKGLELVTNAMQNKCLYYVADWWSYSFCYPYELRQFHAAPVPNGKLSWPPKEDPEGVTYVLGRGAKSASGKKKKRETNVQTNGETKYLAEKWGGGTICDLTGRPRTVEIQWYCGKEGTGERIASIREVAICVYAIVIYSDKLCKEKAFLPVERGGGEKVVCMEVMSADERDSWQKGRDEKKRRLELDAEAAAAARALEKMAKEASAKEAQAKAGWDTGKAYDRDEL